jgi:hypothetical protein
MASTPLGPFGTSAAALTPCRRSKQSPPGTRCQRITHCSCALYAKVGAHHEAGNVDARCGPRIVRKNSVLCVVHRSLAEVNCSWSLNKSNSIANAKFVDSNRDGFNYESSLTHRTSGRVVRTAALAHHGQGKLGLGLHEPHEVAQGQFATAAQVGGRVWALEAHLKG